jgi:hypothetical protein
MVLPPTYIVHTVQSTPICSKKGELDNSGSDELLYKDGEFVVEF